MSKYTVYSNNSQEDTDQESGKRKDSVANLNIDQKPFRFSRAIHIPPIFTRASAALKAL